MRILVTRTDKIGDTILALPVVGDIRRAHPDAEIDFLCARRLVDLVRCDRRLAAVLPYDRGSEPVRLAAELRRRCYDAAIVLYQRERGLLPALRRAGIPIRVGSGRRVNGLLLTHRSYLSRRNAGLHECACNRRIGQRFLAIGQPGVDVLADPPQWDFGFPPAEREWAGRWLADRGLAEVDFVVVQPGTDGSSPPWPLAHLGELLARLHQDRLPAVIHLGPGEESLLERLQACCPAPLFGLSGCSLPQLGALMSRARALVSPSTGPLHLASALDLPTLGFYPPALRFLPQRWGPLASRARALMPAFPGPRPYRRLRDLPADVMAEVSVEEAYRALRELVDPAGAVRGVEAVAP